MQGDSLSDTFAEFLFESLQRFDARSPRRLDFNGNYLLCLPNQKINLHRRLSGCRISLHVEVSPMSIRFQALRDNVFHQHAFVDLKLIPQDSSVELIFQIQPIRESQ